MMMIMMMIMSNVSVRAWRRAVIVKDRKTPKNEKEIESPTVGLIPTIVDDRVLLSIIYSFIDSLFGR